MTRSQSQSALAALQEEQSLELYIDGPDGRNVYHADLQLSDLPTTIAYTIPEDSPGGLYTVTVTWDHQYVRTGFTVAGQPVPESPFPFAVMLFAFTVAILAVSRRKASASVHDSCPSSPTIRLR